MLFVHGLPPLANFYQGEIPANTDTVRCSPIFEIRQSQNTVDATNKPSPHSQWPSGNHLSSMNNTYPSLYSTDSSNNISQNGNASGNPSNDGFENMYGFSIHSLGTEPSPQNSNQEGSGSRSLSNHPTPSTSSNQNSNPSYTSPPTNQTGSSNNVSSSQSQQSPGGFPFSTQDGWNTIGSNQVGPGPSTSQAQNINIASMGMTPGPTGMTPNPTGMTPNLDSFWPPEGMSDGNEWMFGWPGSPPQPGH